MVAINTHLVTCTYLVLEIKLGGRQGLPLPEAYTNIHAHINIIVYTFSKVQLVTQGVAFFLAFKFESPVTDSSSKIAIRRVEVLIL